MTHQHFKNVRSSSIILQANYDGEEHWENMFHMTINMAKSTRCSFHLIDLNQIIQRYLNWKTLFPRVQPYFAHSFQRDPKISYILGTLGAGFSCASYTECKDCLINCPRLQTEEDIKKEIILSNPFKLGSDMRNCRKLGITTTTFMCESELERIKQFWPDAELLMSVVLNPELYEHELTVSKLAAHPDRVEDLLNHVKRLDLHLIGLLCYFGTGYKTVSNWKQVPKAASEIIDKMESFGFKIKILNLGDGFECIDQENEEHEWVQFQEDLSSFNNELSEIFPSKREIELIAQPGRYFTQKSELFAIKVMGKRIKMNITEDKNPEEAPGTIIKEKRGVLIIENSQYISFNFHPGRGNNHPNFWFRPNGDLKNLALHDEESEISATIFGFTCDSLDVISENFIMPDSIAVGDYLLWVNRGTYGSCLMCQFNGMKPPKHFHFINKTMLNKFMEECNIARKEDLHFNLME